MRSATTILGTAAALGLCAALAFPLVSTAAPAAAPPATSAAKPAEGAATYAVDGAHSSMIFRISHMEIANFYGQFNGISGTYVWDEKNPQNSSFNVVVKTESVNTGNERRDGHLKSPDFFNAAEHPEISFRSSSVKKAEAENEYELNGELTMHGVTKPVKARLEWIGAAETRQGQKSGCEAVFSIKRSDFGMEYGVANGALGDRVRVIVALEGATK